MSFRPSKPASQRGAAAAFRAQLSQCTAAAHTWNLQEHSCGAGYADLEEAYELGRAPKWTWSNLVKEDDIRGRSDRERRGLRDIPKEPDALECQICTYDLDEKTETPGSFGREELEVLQELTEDARKTNPVAPIVCGHAFHKNCLARWIREGKTTCPVCRSVIPAEVMLRLVPEAAAQPPVPYNPVSPPYTPVSPQYDPNAYSDDDEFDDTVAPNNYYDDIELPPDTSQQDSMRIRVRLEEYLNSFAFDAVLRPEEEIIQSIDQTIQEALQSMNYPVLTEYTLYSNWGDVLINRSRRLGLYDLATWFEQRRNRAYEAKDRLDRMFDGIFDG